MRPKRDPDPPCGCTRMEAGGQVTASGSYVGDGTPNRPLPRDLADAILRGDRVTITEAPGEVAPVPAPPVPPPEDPDHTNWPGTWRVPVPPPGVVEPSRSDEAHPDAVPVSQTVPVPPLPPPGEPGRCRSCGALIRWVVTQAGKAMPLDPQPDRERGNVFVHVGGEAEVFGAEMAQTVRIGGVQLYLSHFATCPDGPAHRRK